MQRDRDGELHGESDSITEPERRFLDDPGYRNGYTNGYAAAKREPITISAAKRKRISIVISSARNANRDVSSDEIADYIADYIAEPGGHAIPVCADPECRAEHICPDSSTDG